MKVEVISHAKSAKSAKITCPITLALEGAQLHATEGAEVQQTENGKQVWMILQSIILEDWSSQLCCWNLNSADLSKLNGE